MKEYIEKAHSFYKKAIEEFEEGKKKKDPIILRDVCEKSWGAVIEATNAILIKNGFKEPKSHYERRKALETLEKKNDKYKKLFLCDKFGARCQFLHQWGFYEGRLRPDEIETELQKVKNFIEEVEKLDADN